MADTVTIHKAHLEALLRRAECFANTSEPIKTQDVTISLEEYKNLRQSAEEYERLKDALLSGGIPPETLVFLVGGSLEAPRKDSGFAPNAWAEMPENTAKPLMYTPKSSFMRNEPQLFQPFDHGSSRSMSGGATEYQGRRISNYSLQVPHQGLTWQQRRDFGDSNSPMGFDDMGYESAAMDYNQTQGVSRLRSKEKRTLLISGLSEFITYKDLTNVIRGGMVLYIDMRKDRTATVFMLEGAAEFLAHVKRHDLYVQSKRLEVKWNDHQFDLSSHVSHKIAAGATRNMVLRNASRIVNIAKIREHMEHIHKLDIVHIETRGTDVFIYTNSVHNALFARTCMMSRKPYKGLRIEFSEDECAAPLLVNQAREVPRQGFVAAPPRKDKVAGNLYELLSLDGEDEDRPPGREDDDDNTISNGDDSQDGVSLI